MGLLIVLMVVGAIGAYVKHKHVPEPMWVPRKSDREKGG